MTEQQTSSKGERSYRIVVIATGAEHIARPYYTSDESGPEQAIWVAEDGTVFAEDAVRYADPADDPENMTDEQLLAAIDDVICCSNCGTTLKRSEATFVTAGGLSLPYCAACAPRNTAAKLQAEIDEVGSLVAIDQDEGVVLVKRDRVFPARPYVTWVYGPAGFLGSGHYDRDEVDGWYDFAVRAHWPIVKQHLSWHRAKGGGQYGAWGFGPSMDEYRIEKDDVTGWTCYFSAEDAPLDDQYTVVAAEKLLKDAQRVAERHAIALYARSHYIPPTPSEPPAPKFLTLREQLAGAQLPQRTHDELGYLVPKPYRNFAKGVLLYAPGANEMVGVIERSTYRTRSAWQVLVHWFCELTEARKHQWLTAAHLAREVDRGHLVLIPEGYTVRLDRESYEHLERQTTPPREDGRVWVEEEPYVDPYEADNAIPVAKVGPVTIATVDPEWSAAAKARIIAERDGGHWLDKHITEQAEQAAVIFAEPAVSDCTEADEVIDAAAADDPMLPDLSDSQTQDKALELLVLLEGHDFGQGTGNIHIARMLTAVHNHLYDEWAEKISTLEPERVAADEPSGTTVDADGNLHYTCPECGKRDAGCPESHYALKPDNMDDVNRCMRLVDQHIEAAKATLFAAQALVRGLNSDTPGSALSALDAKLDGIAGNLMQAWGNMGILASAYARRQAEDAEPFSESAHKEDLRNEYDALVCPHCGSMDTVSVSSDGEATPCTLLCNECGMYSGYADPVCPHCGEEAVEELDEAVESQGFTYQYRCTACGLLVALDGEDEDEEDDEDKDES